MQKLSREESVQSLWSAEIYQTRSKGLSPSVGSTAPEPDTTYSLPQCPQTETQVRETGTNTIIVKSRSDDVSL